MIIIEVDLIHQTVRRTFMKTQNRSEWTSFNHIAMYMIKWVWAGAIYIYMYAKYHDAILYDRTV